MSLPHEYAASAENEELCFTDHRPKDVAMGICCPQESEHVHAHVHRGEITEDILLEQCIEGCGLPVLRELTGLCETVLQLGDEDHEHREGCGHSQISHGDHTDWLVPLKDGSFKLSHQQVRNGRPSYIEHGRLIKRGKTSLAKINLGPTIVEILSFESPKKKGYESLSQLDDDGDVDAHKRDSFQIVKGQLPDDNRTLLPSPSVGRNVVQGGMMKMDIPTNYAVLCKTTLDVMGICCPSEVPLIKKLLGPLTGVEEVSVNVTSKTVLVLHDQLLVTDVQLVKVLNGAHLDASIHQRGELKAGRNWPSPWCLGSGVLVAIAFFHYIYQPLQWVALGAVAVGVPPLILKAIAALKKFVLDINILMLIAVGGAIALGDYLEAGTIVFLFALAEWLESRSTDKARSAIAAVVDRAPQSATLLDGGTRVRVEEVEVGTLLSVKAGDTIPIDGEVVTGRGFVDESSLTGESVPVEKEQGATVWAGTINVTGYIAMKTTALSVDSAVARMVRLVEEAQNQRSKTEMLVEKIAKYYTPAVVVAALVIGVVPWASGVHNPKHWVYLALVLLVVACPCALVISTPVVVTCGIAQAARLGLLVKGGTYLEILGRLKVVALDKTGTLTEGQFCVSNMLSIDGISTLQEVLYWVSSVENKASHPLAAALVSYARLSGVEPSEDVNDFEVIAGEGVSAVVDDHTVQIGNARMAARLGWDSAAAIEKLADWSRSGATVGWIGLDGISIGIFSVGDQLRPEAAEAVRDLKKLGIQVAMLTGDSTAAATYVQNKIGEIDVFAELLPEDKVRIVQELKEHGVLAMVGDGINDAPALAAADVGIAMGVAGSAVAMETADVALMTNDLRKLAAAVRLGLNCRWKIGQNITFSFVTKLLIIGLAAGGYASLWAAVVADVGTCLVVIFNSMRILKKAKLHGKDQCISQKLEKEFNKNCQSSCCEKDEVDSECCETKAVGVSTVQSSGIAHKHRVLIPWLHKHHQHHHHHHDKKEKCEDDSCCADKDDQPPCCSSARCEKKVLTSRGKGHRHGNNVGGFDKTKGVRMASQVCESHCCSDIPAAPIVQPKLPDCGSSRKCCLPEEKLVQNVELMQKLPTAETSARCCSKESCNGIASRVRDNAIVKSGSECCSRGSCKVPKASDSLPSVAAGCCSTRSAQPANEAIVHEHCDDDHIENRLLDTAETKVSSGNLGPAARCCSNGSCKASLNKTTASPAVEKIKDSESTVSDAPKAMKAVSGCCSSGSCKASLNEKTSLPAVEKSKDSETGVSNAPKPLKAVGGCCSNGSCKSSNKKTSSSTEATKDSDLSASNLDNVKGAVGHGTSDDSKSALCGSENLPANSAFIDFSAGAATTPTASCCTDPSSCRSCIVPVASQA
ncbi:hypothetical protein KC19_6G072400 [Ceratodon purpureus]|nr:hypothetical protein KC19_6G072400 [Ceratodon purpureus]KAG0569198.1 hypothetical protein KC19_6G072400 [Ceratodon purpureus]